MKKNKVFETAVTACSCCWVLSPWGACCSITVYLIVSGLPAIREIGLVKFLFGPVWDSNAATPQFGILPFILSSVYGTLGATLIGVPIGLLTAGVPVQGAGPKVRTVVVTAIELLSGIPQRGVRPAGHAGAGARRGKDLWQGVRCLPAVGHRRCCPS